VVVGALKPTGQVIQQKSTKLHKKDKLHDTKRNEIFGFLLSLRQCEEQPYKTAPDTPSTQFFTKEDT
jgi:hypothetical protein